MIGWTNSRRPQVESVDLVECDLSDETLLLSEIFPKLNYLDIMCDSDNQTNFNQIISHYPYLRKLTFREMNEYIAYQKSSYNNQYEERLHISKTNWASIGSRDVDNY